MRKLKKFLSDHNKQILDFANKLSVSLLVNVIVKFIMWLIGFFL